MSERGRRRSEDAGLTLVELVVAMSLFGLVLAVAYAALLIVQRSTADLMARADATSTARLALQQIDRNVRSASYIGVVGGSKLNVSTRVNDDVDKCMQWRLETPSGGSGYLSTATWLPGATPPTTTTWRRVATDVVNDASTPAFTSGSAGLQTVSVNLLVKGPQAGGKPAAVQASVSGRNAAAGAAAPSCSFPP